MECHEHKAPYCRDGSRLVLPTISRQHVDSPLGDDRRRFGSCEIVDYRSHDVQANPESHARFDSGDSTLVHHHRTRRTGEHLRDPAEPMKNVKAASFQVFLTLIRHSTFLTLPLFTPRSRHEDLVGCCGRPGHKHHRLAVAIPVPLFTRRCLLAFVISLGRPEWHSWWSFGCDRADRFALPCAYIRREALLGCAVELDTPSASVYHL